MGELIDSAPRIRIDLKSLRMSQNETVTGIVYFDLTDVCFPEIGWNDFVVRILDWWVIAIGGLVQAESDSKRLRFMDGPFFVALKKQSGSSLVLECVRDGEPDEIEHSKVCDLKTLAYEILSAAKQVIGACEEQGWVSYDISTLKEHTVTLSRVLAKHHN